MGLLVSQLVSSDAMTGPMVKGQTSDLKLEYEDHLADESLLSDYILWSSVVNSVRSWKHRRRLIRPRHRVKRDEEVICYRDVGCFRDEGPFDYLDTLPQSPDLLETSFTLYTKDNVPDGYTVNTVPPKPKPQTPEAPAGQGSPSLPQASPTVVAPPVVEERSIAGHASAIQPRVMNVASDESELSNNTSVNPDHAIHEGVMINQLFKDKSSFNKSAPIKVIIHGFGSSGKRLWVMQMAEALIKAEPFTNVVVVDWANGAVLPNYVQAAANTRLVGMQLALFIRSLSSAYQIPINVTTGHCHLIGFSLGAHIAGFAGSELNSSISRITGLDPAAPLFEGYPEPVRLDQSDAMFVDVIHTNGDGFLRGGLGSYQSMGHLDFYPNGGRVQVGCNSVFIGAISDLLSYSKSWSQSLCHHRRSFKYFIDSINGCPYRAFKCPNGYDDFLRGNCFQDSATMGYHASESTGRGNYYLATRERQPFCASQYKVRVESADGQGQTWGTLELSIRNETFALNDDQLKDNDAIQGLIVGTAATDETNLVHNLNLIGLKYVKYNGWIFSGKNEWSVQKIVLTNQNGTSLIACNSVPLENNVPLYFRLSEGHECNLWPPFLLPMPPTRYKLSPPSAGRQPSFLAGNKLGPVLPAVHDTKSVMVEMANQIKNDLP
ncbi:Pancreatic triacylglycerol lipase [Halotydeus destructor]|nr:Pancreatic triacylglycerol lipase [Halotydeus destructor]